MQYEVLLLQPAQRLIWKLAPKFKKKSFRTVELLARFGPGCPCRTHRNSSDPQAVRRHAVEQALDERFEINEHELAEVRLSEFSAQMQLEAL